MRYSKLTLILTATALMTGLAASSQAELTIFPEESSTEINSFTSYEVEVENIGPVDDVYEMQHNYPGEISIAPRKVELESGQSKTVNVWFNPRQDRAEGTYSFRIDAKSRADGQTYSTTGRVNVIHNYRTDLQVNPTSNVVCRGETAEYDVTVTNDGIQDDEISVSTERGELSQNRLTLSPDESRTVTLRVSSDNELSDSFNVKASSTRVSYATDTQEVNFNAETCFDSEIEINPETQETAAFTEAEFDVVMRNLGTRTDEFTLSADQGTLTANTVEVGPETTEEVGLSFTPEEVGTHQITVDASGQSEASKTVEVEAYNGMESEVRFDGARTVCREETADYTATVENTGEATETFSLSTSLGTTSDDEVTLAPGETEEVTVTVDAGETGEGEHTVEVTSTAKTFEEPVNSGETTFTVENCWDVSMNVIPEITSAGENMSTIYEVRLENTGTRDNTYRVTHQGPEWISIRPEEITVEAGRTESVYMYAGVPFEKKGQVEITAIAEGTDVRATETVQLVINEEVEEAIRSDRGDFVGRFSGSATDLYQSVMEADNLTRGIAAILIGLLLTTVILIREW